MDEIAESEPMQPIKLSIIVPIYNEAPSIDLVLKKIKNAYLPPNIIKEIIIINDGSTDGTREMLKKYTADTEMRIFNQDKNRGKTQAVRFGMERSSGDLILIQDADLEYDPEDYHLLLEPFVEQKAAVVYGSRFKGKIKKMPLVNRIANVVSNITLRLLFETEITDVHTCYKVFRKEVFKDIEITSANFTFESEITAKLLKKGYKIYEVPIGYVARSRREGKKITWPKALELYWGIIKYRLKD